MHTGIGIAEASLRFEVPAARVFQVLAHPQRHPEFDGSRMLRESPGSCPIFGVGETFTMEMHRMGRDYFMLNHIVEFEQDRRIAWEPAPGDLDTAGGDPRKVSVPAGYRWGFSLEPDGSAATLVTEFFDCGPDANLWILEREGGTWINGSTPIHTS